MILVLIVLKNVSYHLSYCKWVIIYLIAFVVSSISLSMVHLFDMLKNVLSRSVYRRIQENYKDSCTKVYWWYLLFHRYVPLKTSELLEQAAKKPLENSKFTVLPSSTPCFSGCISSVAFSFCHTFGKTWWRGSFPHSFHPHSMSSGSLGHCLCILDSHNVMILYFL